jgi:5-hydroxyisourate hydrolase
MSTKTEKTVDKIITRWQDCTSFEGEAMGRLTTHVLDTAQGKPGAGIAVTLYRVDGGRQRIATAITNADGRCDRPLLDGEEFAAGVYEIVFGVGEYYARSGNPLPEPPFLGEVILRFGVAAPEQHYHVPLLVSPWSYSTYRGS